MYFFFFNDTATTEIYTLSLHDALPIYQLIVGVIFYSVLGGLIAVLVERPKLKWFDDDLAMQILPISILSILWLSGIGPDLPETIIESGL